MSSTDTIKQAAIKDDYAQLKGIVEDCSHDKHSGTKFQCLGHAIDYTQYRELDWAARLFYSIKDYVTNNITVHPSYKHQNSFAVLQQLFSSMPLAKFYSF